MYALEGKWNEYLNATKCDANGDVLPGEEPLRLWTVSRSTVKGQRQGVG